MRFFLLIITFFLLFSCTPPKKHMRERYVNENPELRSGIKKAVIDGDVIVGMTKEQVYASWGTPIFRGEKTEKDITYEYWTFPDKKNSPFVNLYFQGDIVVKMEKLKEQPDIDR